MSFSKKTSTLLSSRDGKATGVAIGIILFAFVVVGGMTVARCGIRESSAISSAIGSMISNKTLHQEQKLLNDVVAPAHLQDAVNAGHQIIGGDEKKTLVRIDGRVFAYDKALGTLMN